MSFCPRCGKETMAGAPFCGACGLALTPAPVTAAPPATAGYAPAPVAASAAPDAVAAPPAYAPQPYAASPAVAAARPITQGTAIAGLLLNILIWPGLGTLVVGDKRGWAQGFTALAGAILSLVLIGIPIFIGAWIWALVTSIQTLQAAK